MLPAELLTYLCADPAHPLAQPLADWLASSRRFTAFVTTFRTKIRKKLRAPGDKESALDLHLELETAYRLLQERTLGVVYEPLPSRQVRGPDFAVTYTTSLTFMLEVTRLRTERQPAAGEGQIAASPPLPGERLVDTIASKLGQLQPQQSNLLLVGGEASTLTAADLHSIMRSIQQRVEGNDAAILQRHHFRDRADFFQHYQRLSEILVRRPQGSAAEPLVWVNPQAKIPLPSKVRTVLYRSQAG